MLWALALLGVLPAAFVFNEATEDTKSVLDTDEPESVLLPDEDDEDDTSATSSESADADDTTSSSETDEAETEVSTFEVLADGEDVTIADFQPGEDTLMLRVSDDGSGEFSVDTTYDGNGIETGVSLSYFDGETETTVNFVGLSEFPADDVTIGVISSETGEESFFALALPEDSSDAEATAEEESEEVLTPNGPAGPDPLVEYELDEDGGSLTMYDDPLAGGEAARITTSSGTMSIETDGKLHVVTGSDSADYVASGDEASVVHAGDGDDILLAGDGTAMLHGDAGDDTIAGGDDLFSDYLLDGGSGDDIITGGDAAEIIIGGTGADTLSGGAGDDTLHIDNDDTVSGGSGADSFILSEDATGASGHAQIDDFEAGTDVLDISVSESDLGGALLDVNVELTEDGLSSQVVVNGDIVAVLYGTTTATLNDVHVAVVS